MNILFLSSLSLAALAGLLALNSAALRAAKTCQKRSAATRQKLSAAREKLRDEEFERIWAQRRKNKELHGATAVRSNAHKATCEAETPVPGYVPVWAYNGVMSVIIYVAPDNVDGRAEERRQNAIVAAKKAERAAWDATTTGRVVSVAKKTAGWAIAAPFILLLLSPFILVACLFVGWVGLPVIALAILVCWFMKDFQDGVAGAVVEKMKNK